MRKSLIPRFVSIKIGALNADVSSETTYLKIITHAKRSHEGLAFIRTPIDEFQLQGPEGVHFCLVYEPMRETLFQLQRRMPRQRLALPLFKLYIYCLLEALDYLHAECRIIHTGKGLKDLRDLTANQQPDIKDDNIMITIENDDVLADFAKYQTKMPQPSHVRSEDG